MHIYLLKLLKGSPDHCRALKTALGTLKFSCCLSVIVLINCDCMAKKISAATFSVSDHYNRLSVSLIMLKECCCERKKIAGAFFLFFS